MGNSLLETKVAGAAAFAKFMTVLQAVADAQQPPTAAALARACGYPRPTVYRILAALAEQGMLMESGGAYRLGPRLLQLASRSWSQFDLRAALAPELQALRDATGETVHLAVPAGAEMVYIDKLESPGPVRMVSRVGAGVALHSSAVGKAYLAALGEAERERLLDGLPLEARMPSTLASLPALRAALAETAARGYAVDDEENEPGIVCYGVGCATRAAGRWPASASARCCSAAATIRNPPISIPVAAARCGRRQTRHAASGIRRCLIGAPAAIHSKEPHERFRRFPRLQAGRPAGRQGGARAALHRRVRRRLCGRGRGGRRLHHAGTHLDHPGVTDLLRALRDKHGDTLLLGVGTVLDESQAREALVAGADFLVSPALATEAVDMAHAAGALCLLGAFTPTEVLARRAGVDMVKIFPPTPAAPSIWPRSSRSTRTRCSAPRAA